MVATGGSSGEGTRSPVKIFGNIFISFIGAGVLGKPDQKSDLSNL